MYRPSFIILFYRSAKMIELKRIDITFTLSNNQVFISKLQMGLKKDQKKTYENCSFFGL